MEALIFHGARRLEIEDAPAPQPGPDEVLIRVHACGICGSDLSGYVGHSPRRNAHIPLIMGHEFSGQVVEVGKDARRDAAESLAPGDRVVVQPLIPCGVCPACRAGQTNICPNMAVLGIERAGAFADLVCAPADRVFKLPAQVSDLDATMTETLAVQAHVFRTMAPPLLRTVVVLGAGPQGLLAAQLARLAGASNIIVTDLVAHRLEMARAMGATHTVHSGQEDVVERVKTITGGWGAEFIVDTAGAPATRQQGVAALAPGGTLVLIGLGKGDTTLNFLPVVNRELHVRGSYAYTDDDFLRAVELIAAGQVRVREMIHLAPLSEGAQFFERLATQPEHLVKVVLQPGQARA